MNNPRPLAAGFLALALLHISVPCAAAAQSTSGKPAADGFTMAQVKSYPFPNELVAAPRPQMQFSVQPL